MNCKTFIGFRGRVTQGMLCLCNGDAAPIKVRRFKHRLALTKREKYSSLNKFIFRCCYIYYGSYIISRVLFIRIP